MVKGHRFNVRRKIMENEENRGLIHKKAFEDQLLTYFQFSFRSLSLFSLSLSLSQSWTHQVYWSTLALEQERKKRQEEAKIKQGKARSSNYNRLHCRVRLACVFSLLDSACMVLHVVLFYHGMGFPKCDNVLQPSLSIS